MGSQPSSGKYFASCGTELKPYQICFINSKTGKNFHWSEKQLSYTQLISRKEPEINQKTTFIGAWQTIFGNLGCQAKRLINIIRPCQFLRGGVGY
jgi:hypothetical protein